MVRLKDLHTGYYDRFSGISIPYGAIKSISLQNFLVVGIIFQFLMVRLKASFRAPSVICTSNFNSLWCD